MSDEYASTGYKGSLVNSTMNEAPNEKREAASTRTNKDGNATRQQGKSDFETHNYPSDGDTTSEGGYGTSTNVWSGRAQRGNKTGTGTYGESVVGGEGLTNQGKDGAAATKGN
ncbi:hypothetical protein H0H87_011291 [Tephrocybe sp. NHM501043]|nr:hypothetical protein H0H87_011291 [Tephrocybe sp. NHM501043]